MKMFGILRSVVVIVSIGALAGCGMGGGGGLPSNDPGTGSGTLDVQAFADATDIAGDGGNAPTNFGTTFTVVVRTQGGSPVTDATVTMTTDTGPYVLSSQGNGRYSQAHNGYSRVNTLSVTSGNDFVSGASLVGPDLHRISYPVQKGTYPPNTPMTTTWERTVAAQDIEIGTRIIGFWVCNSNDQGMPAAADSGSYTLPADPCFNFPFPVSVSVRIVRRNIMSIAGGITGSTFTASVRNEIEPIDIQ